jgi:hypothetical protein
MTIQPSYQGYPDIQLYEQAIQEEEARRGAKDGVQLSPQAREHLQKPQS